jgi:hypothetical protein
MNDSRRKILLAATIFGTIVGLPVVICTIGYLILISHNDDWKKETTPLPLETITTLCGNFNLPQEHRLCDGKGDVYAPDFTRIIVETFRPYEEYQINSAESATYEEVEKKIGTYKFKCGSVITNGDGFSYFECYYDFRGDRFSTLMIIFSYPENAVFRVTGIVGDDD